ncbi:MAG: OmpA family protein [Thiovulaceae bacterium]|nr:OmpA family protein [Sulfurimonadaceae bacterium]
MKHSLYLSILFAAFAHAAPSDFSLVLEKNYENALVDVTQNYDRSITALGVTRNFQTPPSQQSYSDPYEYLKSVSGDYGAQLHLVRVGLNGDLQKEQTIKLSGFATPASLLKTPNGGYFVGGSTHKGSFLLLKLSPQGDTEWHREFDATNKDTVNTLVALQDGGVLIVGTTFASRAPYENIFDSGIGGNDISVLRISKNGTALWSKRFGTQGNDFGIDAQELQDGSLMLLGNFKEKNSNGISLIKISQNGDMLWLHTLEAKSLLHANKLTKLSNDDLLLSLTQIDDVGKKQIRLLKIDPQQNILKDKAFATVYPSELFDLKEFVNGDLFAVGEVRDAQNTDALVMRLDSELNLICQEHFGDQSFDTFKKMHILHNSQIAAVGKHTAPVSQEANMWLVKLNDDCTLAQRKEDGALHSELATLLEKEIDAKELSLAKNLLLELNENALYFEVGKYALTAEHKEFLDRFATKLIPFLVKYRHIIDTVEINGHTSSEWGDVDFTQGYLNNAKLSMNRSYSVLHYLFSKQDTQTKRYLTQMFKGGGWSYARKKMVEKTEDKEKSRRVTFKIVLK